ncbi:hypothetical protein [Sphingomonas sp. Leaf357]|uniref:hypothetical protein n=1 Tax=Sphingomonas sp. Leaf357 TaxID=1736350 RepID=UPI001F2DFF99|nr:hypothetical protein [Sphingomonas sp. Leaf357]
MKISVNMGNVWDRATEFLGDHLAAILPIAVLAIVVPSTVSAIIAPLGAAGGLAALPVNLISLALTLVTVWAQLAIVALALDRIVGRGAAMQVALRRLLPFLGVLLVLLVAFVIVMLPIPFVLAGYGMDMQAAMANGAQVNIPPAAAGIISIYTIVLVPVLIFVGARLALLTPVVVCERRGLGSIGRSFALSRGLVWKIIGMLILYGIVAGVAILATRTVFGSVLRLALGGEGLITPAGVLTALIVAIVQTVFVLLACAFTAKLYLAVADARGTIVEPV